MPSPPASLREGCLARGIRTSWPHLVLIVIYLSYLGIGGWVFLAIEGGDEANFAREVKKYEMLKAQIDGVVRNLTEGREVTAAGNLTDVWDEYKSLVDSPYRQNLAYSSGVNWTFTASVLFCATSIATIGKKIPSFVKVRL